MRKTWMFYGLFFYFSLFGGLANAQDALTQLQQMYMMKELLPEMQTAGIIVNGSSVDMAELQQKLERVSATLKIKIVISDARSLKDVSAEFKKLPETIVLICCGYIRRMMCWVTTSPKISSLKIALSKKFRCWCQMKPG